MRISFTILKTPIIILLLTLFCQGAFSQTNNFRGLSLRIEGTNKTVFVKEDKHIKITTLNQEKYRYKSKFTIINDRTIQMAEGIVKLGDIKLIKARRRTEPILGTSLIVASIIPIVFVNEIVSKDMVRYGEGWFAWRIGATVIGTLAATALVGIGTGIASSRKKYACNGWNPAAKYIPSVFIGNPDSLLLSINQKIILERERSRAEKAQIQKDFEIKKQEYFQQDSIQVLKVTNNKSGKIIHVKKFEKCIFYFKNEEDIIVTAYDYLNFIDSKHIQLKGHIVGLDQLIKIRTRGVIYNSQWDSIIIETVKNGE